MDGPESITVVRGVDDVLAHYGKIGMHWGQRKSAREKAKAEANEEAQKPKDVTLSIFPGKKVKASGGANHLPSADAQRAAAYQQKIKASGIQSLSSDQLKIVVNRINTEQAYNKLVPVTPKKMGFLKKTLMGVANVEINAMLEGGRGPLNTLINNRLIEKKTATGVATAAAAAARAATSESRSASKAARKAAMKSAFAASSRVAESWAEKHRNKRMGTSTYITPDYNGPWPSVMRTAITSVPHAQTHGPTFDPNDFRPASWT